MPTYKVFTDGEFIGMLTVGIINDTDVCEQEGEEIAAGTEVGIFEDTLSSITFCPAHTFYSGNTYVLV